MRPLGLLHTFLSPSPSIPSFFLKFHASFSLKSPTSTFRAFSDAEEDEEDDEEEDQDQDNVSADEYDDVLGEASDEADVFARHDGFNWQRVDKLCNEVREFGADLIEVDELASVYDLIGADLIDDIYQRWFVTTFSLSSLSHDKLFLFVF